MKNEAINWVLSSQKLDGSWGVFKIGTCEETAYGLQALKTLKPTKNIVSAIKKGKEYLSKNYHGYTFPELWIGKVLYCPTKVVRTAVESVLDT